MYDRGKAASYGILKQHDVDQRIYFRTAKSHRAKNLPSKKSGNSHLPKKILYEIKYKNNNYAAEKSLQHTCL